jgi:D-alanyl-D-alanine carboxypeptidase
MQNKKEIFKYRKFLENTLKVFVTFFLISIFFIWLKLFQNVNWTKKEIQSLTNISENLPKQIVEIEAEKYIIYNLDTGQILSEKKGNLKSPIASISKIITVATFLKTLRENNLNIDDKNFEYAKSKIQKALIQSDNEDAEILGEIYKQKFNRNLLLDAQVFLQSLKIEDFTFANLTGLDLEKSENGKKVFIPSNFLSAEDLAKVFKYIYENERGVFEYTKWNSIKTDDNKEIAINTNNNVEKTFGLLISKTGYTDTAKGNLATVINFAPGETYLIVVLQSSKEGRFTDVQKLISVLPNF